MFAHLIWLRRCYNPLKKKIVVNRDVIFDELSSWYSPKQNVEPDEDNENEDKN